MSSATQLVIQWLQTHMSCKRFARLIASDDPQKGGIVGRIHFWLHWTVCPFCRRYWSELREIGRLQKDHSSLRRHPAVKVVELKQRLKQQFGSQG